MLRLRPIMMTMLVATLGLLPAALSRGIGSDSQRPFAIVIVGGLMAALMLTSSCCRRCMCGSPATATCCPLRKPISTNRNKTMTREEVRARIEKIGIIPAIRVSTPEDALFAAEAVAEGGIPIVELTMTVPGAIGVIAALVKQHPDLVVGAGTVLDTETAARCLDAGAMFLTSTGLELDVVRSRMSGIRWCSRAH